MVIWDSTFIALHITATVLGIFFPLSTNALKSAANVASVVAVAVAVVAVAFCVLPSPCLSSYSLYSPPIRSVQNSRVALRINFNKDCNTKSM